MNFLEAGQRSALNPDSTWGVLVKCRVIAVLGTRPEAIKLALVIHELRRRSDQFETAVVHTGQHRTMLDHVLRLFQIRPDFDLDVMRANQTLTSLTCRVLDTVENACHRFQPNMVLVQGDTTTAFASALAAYYNKIPVGHIEAGLRSWDMYNPFPEEANRRLVSVTAEIHFAPTVLARDNLLREGVPNEKIVVTGNTVIDTLAGAERDAAFLGKHSAREHFHRRLPAAARHFASP